MKRAISLVVCALFVACSAHTPVPVDSPQPSTPSVVPSASKAAARVPSARSAVWTDGGGLWTYDVAKNEVTEIAKGSGIHSPAWESARQITFVQDSGTSSTLRLFDTKTQQVSDLFSVDTGIVAYGMSPDGEIVAYVTVDGQSYPHLVYRFLVGDQATQTVTTLGRALGREATPNDQRRIEFSPDGQAVLVVYTPADGEPGHRVNNDASQLQIRGLDGTLLYGVDMSRDPTMGFWSADGTKVYYRTTTGTRAWSRATGSSQQISGSVKWFDPWPSRDGRNVAFDDGAFDEKVRVATLDFKTGKSAYVTGAGFAWPVFANSKTVWVQRATPCKPNCIQPVTPGPEVIAVDLKTGSKTKLKLPTLQNVSVWYA